MTKGSLEATKPLAEGFCHDLSPDPYCIQHDPYCIQHDAVESRLRASRQRR